jgi:hypothetical protein
MVGLLIAFPGLVSTPDKAATANPASIQLEAAPAADQGAAAPADGKEETAEDKATREKEEEEEDPAKALMRSMNQDKK